MSFYKRLLFFLLGIYFSPSGINTSCAQVAKQGLTISGLTDNIFIYTTWQEVDGKPYPANGMYAVTNEGVIMVDAPWDTMQVQPLLDSIQQRHNKKVILCIATHYHSDRTGGFNMLERNGVATWSSALTKLYCIKNNESVATHIFLNDTTFTLGDLTLITFYPGPAHAPDNIVVWFPAQKILYGGCMIKSTESGTLGNLADADVFSWPKSIHNIEKKYRKVNYVIPGHESWSSTNSIQHTLQMLKEYKSGR